MVGNTVYITVKMENMFSTPLQIRKAYLLWKFLPDDSDDVIMNDKKETVTAEYVDTGELDTTVIDKNSVADLVFSLTFLFPGKVNIIGKMFQKFLRLSL